MSTRFEMRIEDDLLAKIDKERGDVPRSRWVRRALEAALVPKAARSGDTLVDAVADEPAFVDAVNAQKRAIGRSAKPVARDTQRDANAEYARMMAERQARMEKGR